MRLLLRANSHRPLTPVGAGPGAGFEIAASPDTPTRPDRWSWHIRVLEAGLGGGTRSVLGESPRAAATSTRFVEELGPGAAFRVLEVGYDPDAVEPDIELLDVAGAVCINRDEQDLTVILVAAGDVRVEDRHDLAPGDVLILAGDDPLSVGMAVGMAVDTAAAVDSGEPAASVQVVIVTLRATGPTAVSWVP